MTRMRWTLIAGVSCAAALGSSAFDVPVAVLWNTSPSAPVGLYGVRPASSLKAGELVVVSPPEPVGLFLHQRGYLGEGIPMLKRIAALPGQLVCRFADTVSVDGVAVGRARELDRRGRPLPRWRGCHRLGQQQIFLMNAGVEDSLDGRYFGPLPRRTVIGRAFSLYVDGESCRPGARLPQTEIRRNRQPQQPKGDSLCHRSAHSSTLKPASSAICAAQL